MTDRFGIETFTLLHGLVFYHVTAGITGANTLIYIFSSTIVPLSAPKLDKFTGIAVISSGTLTLKFRYIVIGSRSTLNNYDGHCIIRS